MPVFLFTDIEGSTIKWERHREEMGRALSRHDAILDACLGASGGRAIKHTGDGVFAIFEEGDPLRCALEIQKHMAGEDWGAVGDLRVRMALHAGEAEKRKVDYFGPVINRTARLLSAGWGGQVLLSSAAVAACPLPPQAALQDLGTHLLKDLAEPEQVYGLAHPDLPLRNFPPLRTLSASPNNLPPQVTPFIGREKEMAEILQRIQQPSCRLLTLVGPGGIGKTRLALQAAAESIEAFPQGVYFVPLAPLSPKDFLVTTIGEFLLVSALADALRFSFYSREDPKNQLLNYLREKDLLLVMDNFEHLLKGSGLMTEILNAAPKIKILVTTRERLNLRGEWTYDVRGMGIPEQGKPGDALECSAVQLFVENARRVDSSFRLRKEEEPCVVRICRLVDGIPLGIELASAWARVLSCMEIAKEIEKNRDFLESSLRDISKRHRSLRAVFDYSWNLLKEEERMAYQRLAIFRGGFRREAAEHVAGATLPLLTALVDKSLLRKNPSGRYELLDVLRQYAEEKLRQNPGELEEASSAHATYWGEFLHLREEALVGEKQGEVLGEIAIDIENIRESWQWAVSRLRGDLLLRHQKSLFRCYMISGKFREAEELYDGAAAAFASTNVGGPDQKEIIGSLRIRQAAFNHRLGRNEQARPLFEDGLARLRSSGARGEIAFGLNHYGILLHGLGEYTAAGQAHQEALEIARELGWREGLALALNCLGNVTSVLGDHREARRLYEESLALRREMKDLRGMAGCLNNLGIVAEDLGAYEESRSLYQESLLAYRGIGDLWGTALALDNLGNISRSLNDYPAAKQLFQESLAIRKDIGDRRGIAMTLDNLGFVTLLMGNPAEAKTPISESLAIRRELNDPRGIAYARYHLGLVAQALGNTPSAKGHFCTALRTALEIQVVPLILEILVGIASLWAGEKASDTSRERRAEQTLELLAFCLAHSACDRASHDRAQRLFSRLALPLPPQRTAEIREKAKTKLLEDVVKEALTSCSPSG